ncbi:MAG: thiamine-phosphate kinase [Chromatiales bacterium]|nr:thiamine-phosphate kinase [Chromatiales bacterium]
MTEGRPSEDQLIGHWFRRSPPRPDVALGIGDDAALLSLPPGSELACAVDTLVEGTHFLPASPARSLGHRCLAVNLSDLAAMAATPAWALLSLSLEAPEPAWLDGFAEGLFALARRFEVVLVGGDTVAGPRAVSLTLLGHVPPGQAIRRSGARPGDGIWVTGWPGDAVAGRLLLAAGGAPAVPAQLSQVARFEYPEPRCAEGVTLRGIASAMLDLSDGLATDLARLLSASGAGAEVELDALPRSGGLALLPAEQALAHALYGGDDYELCFTVPPRHERALAGVSAGWGCPVTRIGRVTAAPGITWLRQGEPVPPPAGERFSHF